MLDLAEDAPRVSWPCPATPSSSCVRLGHEPWQPFYARARRAPVPSLGPRNLRAPRSSPVCDPVALRFPLRRLGPLFVLRPVAHTYDCFMGDATVHLPQRAVHSPTAHLPPRPVHRPAVPGWERSVGGLVAAHPFLVRNPHRCVCGLAAQFISRLLRGATSFSLSFPWAAPTRACVHLCAYDAEAPFLPR